jgi:hypothetical protein
MASTAHQWHPLSDPPPPPHTHTHARAHAPASSALVSWLSGRSPAITLAGTSAAPASRQRSRGGAFCVSVERRGMPVSSLRQRRPRHARGCGERERGREGERERGRDSVPHRRSRARGGCSPRARRGTSRTWCAAQATLRLSRGRSGMSAPSASASQSTGSAQPIQKAAWDAIELLLRRRG